MSRKTRTAEIRKSSSLAVVLLLVSYPLSIGPAIWLIYKNLVPKPCEWLFFYGYMAPLSLIAWAYPPFLKVVLWYAGLWIPN